MAQPAQVHDVAPHGVGTACTGDVRVRTMYVIIVIDLVELHSIQWSIAVITPFGRP